ncbi:MAG: substrate-binding periplasmic protein [Chloroflexia bacterium]
MDGPRKGVNWPDLLLFFLVWVLLWAAGFFPPWLDDEVRRRIEATRTVRVGLDPAYPPFENEVEGQLVGYDVDLARALGQRLNLQVEFVPLGYDSLYDALLSGRIDVILSSYPYSPELCCRERCTQPYFQAGQMLVVRAGSPIAGPQDLAGRSVGVEWGGPGDGLVRRWERAGQVGTRQTFMSPQEALEALVAGRVDAVVVDRLSALTFAGREKVAILEPPLQEEAFVAVVARRSVWLHRRLEQALYGLEREGFLSELEERWCH